MDKDAKGGLVYKNTIENYIEMKLSDIVDKTMFKLNEHLLDFNEEAKISKVIIDDYFIHNRRRFNGDLSKYEKNSDFKEEMTNAISDLYEKKKEESINILKNISK